MAAVAQNTIVEVEATVSSMGQDEAQGRKYTYVELDIPAWSEDFNVRVNFIGSRAQELLTLGKKVNVQLRAGNLRQTQDGEQRPGDNFMDFWWRMHAVDGEVVSGFKTLDEQLRGTKLVEMGDRALAQAKVIEPAQLPAGQELAGGQGTRPTP